MVETGTAVAVIQLVLTVGGIVYTVVSWVNNGTVARSVRKQIGIDNLADRVGDVQESVNETRQEVHQIEERMDTMEKGVQGIAIDRERDDMSLDVQVFLRELSDDNDTSVLDFMDEEWRSDGGGSENDRGGPGGRSAGSSEEE